MTRNFKLFLTHLYIFSVELSKKIIQSLVIVIVGSGIWLGILYCCGTRTNLPNNISGSKIKMIKPGMTLKQVLLLLGNPYQVTVNSGMHNLNCSNIIQKLELDINAATDVSKLLDSLSNRTTFCCDGNKIDMQRKEYSLIYTKPVTLSNHYPMLWIHLDSNLKVMNIYARRFSGGLFLHLKDESGFYNYSKTNIYENDTTKLSLHINEKIFSECFK